VKVAVLLLYMVAFGFVLTLAFRRVESLAPGPKKNTLVALLVLCVAAIGFGLLFALSHR